ncbi:MAG: SMP-30/gluconolactonase/LRE family protein [Acidobacteriota bacterium]
MNPLFFFLALLLTGCQHRPSNKIPISDQNSIFEADAHPVQLLDRGAGEGPAWHPELGLLFSGSGRITRYARDGSATVYREQVSNGLMFDAKGRLVACEPGLRRVTRKEADGTIIVLTDQYEGSRYNSPNDLSIDSSGRIYFSDPRYGSRDGMEMRDADDREIEGVYRIDPDGTVSRVITHEVDRPNGVLVSLDGRFLYVADNNNNNEGGARKLWKFDLDPATGDVDLASQILVFDWGTSRGPDGMAQDRQGRLYVAAGLNQAHLPFETVEPFRAGIYVLSPDGELLAFVPVGNDEVTNCAFGDEDLRTLFITAGGTLWSIRTSVPGAPVWP